MSHKLSSLTILIQTLCFLLLGQHREACAQPWSCSAIVEPDVNATSDVIDALFQICLRSPDCITAYHLIPEAPNRTVFRHQLPAFVFQETLLTPIKELMSMQTTAEVNDRLWALRLCASRSSKAALCDMNHNLVFNAETMQSSCQCKADRICADHLYDQAPFFIAVILGTIALLGFFAYTIYANIKLLRQVDRISERGDGLRALKLALSA